MATYVANMKISQIGVGMPKSPTSWSRYLKFQNGEPTHSAAQFRARFRMAKSYSGSMFDGLASNSQIAYSELIRAGLIYSVVETYGRMTLGRHWNQKLSIVDKCISDTLRALGFADMHKMLSANLEPTAKRRHDVFVSGEVDDLVVFYAGLRHMVFHGHATAYGAGLPKSKKTIAVLQETSIWLLEQIDDLFTAYVDNLEDKGQKV